ncbi:WGR domain-containing protein [Rhodococcus sp. NCIMB 12038]|uniref:WGR domain-containing protein n=1 Tax=Rhodococcus sp. NCIMB 12038 TaxID=933800 RepID=UPI000B3BEE1F|nr:WGR domain-containing protein [Rhodococcus sp. NCIMB 12038]OUS97385.1 hypothetical protein CA951_03305 [Rhodococcus sp. NCIMB 12038]
MTEIHIAEAQYVDPRAGNDKFYRTFVIGSSWVTQYGRNGTIGTFTKLVETASEMAAVEAAAAKFTSKVKKGYAPSQAGSLILDRVVDLGSLDVLDELADRLPASSGAAASAVMHEPAATVDLGPEVLPDCTRPLNSALLAAGVVPTINFFTTSSLPPRPMLAAVLPADDVSGVLESEDWVTQFKYDGDRVLVEVDAGRIRVLNRQGEVKTRNVGRAQLLPFTALHVGRWVFDGEVVGRTLVLFDLVSASSEALAWVTDGDSFTTRYMALCVIAESLGVPTAEQDTSAPVVVAPVAFGPGSKARMLTDAVMDQREGVIARRRAGVYEQGRRSMDLLKHKLIKDVDVVVTGLHATKESATLSVHNEYGNLVEVGSVSTIGKGPVSVGGVWVVTFLYVTDPNHPRLVQPRLVRRRTDKTPTQCLLDQFADAGTKRIV